MPPATYKKVSEKVGLLQLDDGQANSFGPEMIHEVYRCLEVAEKDLLDCEGALVIAGNPRLLSGGYDLKTLMKGPDAAKQLINEGAAMIERMVVFPRPLIVAATGHAVALGAFVLLTGDYRIGAANVGGGKPLKVGLNETANGMLMPEFFVEGARFSIAPQYLREAVGLGLIFDAPRAQEVGFLDEIVSHEKVLDVAIAKAEELAAWCKHPAFRHNKKLLRGPMVDVIAEGRKSQKPGEDLKWLNPPAKL